VLGMIGVLLFHDFGDAGAVGAAVNDIGDVSVFGDIIGAGPIGDIGTVGAAGDVD
jgi:hypothetical protein